MQKGHLLAAYVLGSLFTISAYAHDEALWIERDPSFIGEDGKHCCGPGDCMRFAEGDFQRDGDEIYFLPTMQKFQRNGPGIYQSQTSDWWACIPGGTGMGPAIDPTRPPMAICIFVPIHTQ